MDRERIVRLLEDFEPFQQVKSAEGLEELTLQYLDSSQNHPDDVADIKQLMGGNNLYSLAVYFHEMYECLKLSERYSQDQIVSGIAHRQGYQEAHDKSQLEMFRLYQHLAQKVLDRKIPLKALALASPNHIIKSKNSDDTIVIVYEHISFGRFQSQVDKEQITSENVVEAMKFYETFGLKYGSHKNTLLERIGVVSGLKFNGNN